MLTDGLQDQSVIHKPIDEHTAFGEFKIRKLESEAVVDVADDPFFAATEGPPEAGPEKMVKNCPGCQDDEDGDQP